MTDHRAPLRSADGTASEPVGRTSHRADTPGRRRANVPVDSTVAAAPYSGRRAARPGPAAPVLLTAEPDTTVTASAGVSSVADQACFADDSTVTIPVLAEPGRRRAVKPRGGIVAGLPSTPVLVGAAAVAISLAGAVTASSEQGPSLASSQPTSVRAANALSGASGISSFDVMSRGSGLSRSDSRDALAAKAGVSRKELRAAAEDQVRQRNAALLELARKAEGQAQKIELNQWQLPVESGVYHLTARFGQYGLWASYHTGLDFAAPTGTPIHAIANGVVTSASFDGAYGNKTVVTLDDGTELWYCHQNAFGVSAGDQVLAGQVIGYVGSTGHVTGPHVHIEVRPGGGDPVDPFPAFVQHGVTP